MCGIAGIYFKKIINGHLLDRFEHLVKASQYKRGPDEFNKLQISSNLFFYHNMLSIIDIGNAKQPMSDEKGILTYNGEIYNYRDLKYSREKYAKKSDTEVLLKGLNNEYIEFLKRTNSMFGLAYYNISKAVLLLCRDRLGIKPIYYIDNDDVFAFASTITPLTIFSNKKLNHRQLWQFYSNRAFKAPATIFDDIYELPAASFLEFDTRQEKLAAVKSWWTRNKVEELYTNENEVIETIEQLLVDSIKNRLVADVPVGLFLSGGVDSSLVAALTAKQTSKLNAFTVSFYDEKFDESPYAKQVCKQFGIRYNEIKVNATDFLDSINHWITIQDDIVADPSALLLYKISEYASSMNYRALLAGEGSDELFAGYNSYKYFNLSRTIYNSFGKNVPFKKNIVSLFKDHSKWQDFLSNSLHTPTFYGTAKIFEPHLLTELLPDFNNDEQEKVYDLKNAMDLDIKDRIQNDILTRSDRSTSGASIELRVPFLSHQLVNYSAGISQELLMKNKTSKYLVKKLASKYLDRDLIYRKKVGFDLPIRHWISNELRDLMEENIDNSIQKDFINMNVIKRCFDLHVKSNIDYSTKLWAFLCLELSYKYLYKIY
ncbi:asparagine synthase (glutamine-hydrolyzing) [Chryseolinea sp. H1M3-3]|uniref:asparagine synthase (glutamine-hydrolyzing) n=1 Tax=Chryseolinea sp. H1M3-3 TaxID=3034144 RepID=UPI0023EBA5E9|nr:asparagine synthase (glutamine-hydrolyzing) [Chryseolinea sp. H1M3-3]